MTGQPSETYHLAIGGVPKCYLRVAVARAPANQLLSEIIEQRDVPYRITNFLHLDSTINPPWRPCQQAPYVYNHSLAFLSSTDLFNMPIKSFASRLALSLAICGTAMGQKVNGADYNKPDGGPPAKFFQASSSIPVAAIQAAAAKASKVPSHATYPIGQGSTKSTIHSDWAGFSEMFYGIFGDSNGDSPQVTGEASWLMARTCFPEEDLNGNKGHTAADVTYIVFTGDKAVLPSSALNKNYITNFDTLRSMGDSLVGALAKNLNLGGGGGNPPTTLTTTSIPEPTGGSGSCSWPGHCAGEDNHNPPPDSSEEREGQDQEEE
ncbi:unnamed protein product [Aspergillus oryzae]|nr:unnamed protein product [Aspergillus oryzae]